MTEWPVQFRGVTESVVATRGPDGRWNLAALGLFPGDRVTARTWGRTRTRRNFERRGASVVQFTRDPVHFVDAALTVWEADEPVVESADAWVEVSVERVDSGESDGTTWVEWALTPQESAVENRTVPTTNRGYYAVVEASVAASRLGVPGYDDEALRERIDYFAEVVEGCGDDRAREAFERVRERT